MTLPPPEEDREEEQGDGFDGAQLKDLEELLEFLRDERGFDFTGYKRTSLGRRVRRRMQEIGMESVSDYRSLLEGNLDEFTALFNTILINVTGFFRDPAAWSYLESEIVPAIVSRLEDGGPIRLWSAGCASGEEAYTLAIVMARALGVPSAGRRVKIYGTDVDLDALTRARAGVYTEQVLEGVPAELRSQYFQPDARGRGFAIVPALRRTIVFGRHDLTRDPPISHIDLLCCRNTLMYLNSETQALVIPRLHYALRDSGYLFLGRAEMVVHGGAGRFEPVSVQHRIFVSIPEAPAPRQSPSRLATREPFNLGMLEAPLPDRSVVSDKRPESSFVTSLVVAQLMVSPDGALVGANPIAREIFGIEPGEMSRALRELPFADGFDRVIAAIEKAIGDGSPQDLGSVHLVTRSGASCDLVTQIFPTLDEQGKLQVVSVTMADVGGVSSIHEDFQQMHAELETAYEELQSTNEELVTSNEELQSSYEELETTNEELQSANEELETTNEELRSSNEELETTNVELKSASDALEHSNLSLTDANNKLNRFSDLHRHVMDSFPSAVVVLDSQLLIREWNRAATDLWGLREDEVLGEPFFGLDFGLPLDGLQEPVRACRSPGAVLVTLQLEAINRLGRRVSCEVAVVPAAGDGVPPSAMLIMQVIDEKPS